MNEKFFFVHSLDFSSVTHIFLDILQLLLLDVQVQVSSQNQNIGFRIQCRCFYLSEMCWISEWFQFITLIHLIWTMITYSNSWNIAVVSLENHAYSLECTHHFHFNYANFALIWIDLEERKNTPHAQLAWIIDLWNS